MVPVGNKADGIIGERIKQMQRDRLGWEDAWIGKIWRRRVWVGTVRGFRKTYLGEEKGKVVL